MASIEQPDPGRELGRHINNLLAGLDQTLSQRPAGAVGALDHPDPVATPSRRTASLRPDR